MNALKAGASPTRGAARLPWLLPSLLALLAACSRGPDASPAPTSPIAADSALVPASSSSALASPAGARLAASAGETAAGPAGVGSAGPVAGSTPPAGSVATPGAASAAPSGPSVATMLTRLQALQRALGKDPLTADDVAIHTGTPTDDPKQPPPAVPRPLAPGIEKARIGRFMGNNPQSGQIYLVTVDLAAGSRPTIAELRSIFGPEHVGALALHGEREAMYYPATTGKGWHAAVIASLSPCFDPHSSAEPPPGPCDKIHAGSRVERITFRRDGP